MLFVDRFVISSMNRILRVREGRPKGKKGAATLPETIIETVPGPLPRPKYLKIHDTRYTLCSVSMPGCQKHFLSSPRTGRVSTIQLKYVAVFKGPVPCLSPLPSPR